jgi:hypothetical protein
VVCVPEVTGTVAWCNICIPVEVKKANDGFPALPQLVGYARECLREQPNRRFIYGLTLCNTFIQVWLFDRSGARGSEQIDVHKVSILSLLFQGLTVSPLQNPRALIRIIAGFAYMSNPRLGYDPTLVPHSRNDKSPARSQWKVEMIVENNEAEELLLFEVISQAQAEVLCGRSTRIWKAWRMGEIGKSEAEREVCSAQP